MRPAIKRIKAIEDSRGVIRKAIILQHPNGKYYAQGKTFNSQADCEASFDNPQFVKFSVIGIEYH